MDPEADTPAPRPLADPGPDSEPAAVCFARDPVEAGLICARLGAEGICAHASGVTFWQMLWQMGPAVNPRGLAVLVRRADLPRAGELIARMRGEAVGADEPDEADRADEPEASAGRPESATQRLMDVGAEPAETPAQRDVRRGFWAAVIFFLSLVGLPMAVYSLVLLWRGRAAWNDPDPRARRRARRRIVLGLIADAAMMLLLAFLVYLIVSGLFSLSPEVGRSVTPEPVEMPLRP